MSVESGAVALAFIGRAFLANEVLLVLEGELAVLGYEDHDRIIDKRRPDIVEILRAVVIVIDADDHVRLAFAGGLLRFGPCAFVFGAERDIEILGNGLDQARRCADDAVALFEGDGRILRVPVETIWVQVSAARAGGLERVRATSTLRQRDRFIVFVLVPGLGFLRCARRGAGSNAVITAPWPGP
ncbi:hypothetical protein AUC71_10105 [Methyloceanibacter marginalis]|uniref:Uncharacterized protein n=1 Tax=Methyloceanibacter marginalis TaxID=1774971 RepID=A0A1E3WE92_9HYPH|nr:hypothetical protein [Methyloceanibacter marginalis]ODS03377.1 hypothetical protein AUC71_10105 [Methyloceanibacter marginalis]